MAKFKLDDTDHQILDMLIDNTRTPFTDIAKRLEISAGTVHVRVKKMEEAGIITGSSLQVDYKKLGYSFIAYVGVYLNNTSQTKFVSTLENICTFSKAAYDLIRSELKFKKVIITDDMEMQAITDHFSKEKAALIALDAGADVLVAGSFVFNAADPIATIEGLKNV